MKLKIGWPLIDYFVLWWLLISYTFLGFTRIPWLVLDGFAVFCFAHFFLNLIKNFLAIRPLDGAIVLIFFYICLIAFMNMLLGGVTLITIVKFWDTFKYIPVFWHFSRVFNQNKSGFILFQKYLYYFLLITLLINTPIIIYQIYSGVHFDYATGTFLGSSAHTIGFVWTLLLVFQIQYDKNGFLTMVVALLMFVISVLADNNSFLFFLAALLGYWVFKSFRFRLFARRIIIMSIFVIVTVPIVQMSLPQLQNLMYKAKIGSIEKYFSVRTLNNFLIYSGQSQKKDERLQLLSKALSSEGAYDFGNGIGLISDINNIKGEKYRKVDVHLTMNEIASQIYEGGVWYFILVMILFTAVFQTCYTNVSLKYVLLTFVLLLVFSQKCDWIYDDRSCFFVFLIWCIGGFSISFSKNALNKKRLA